MEYYQKMISGCLYSQKYRYTTSNLNRWPIPRIKKEDAIVIAGYVDELLAGASCKLENAIDKIVYDAFDLSEEEILKIEKEEAEIYICVDNYSRENIDIIERLCFELRNINLVTDHIRQFHELEKRLERNEIYIAVSNNKRKALKRAEIILMSIMMRALSSSRLLVRYYLRIRRMR